MDSSWTSWNLAVSNQETEGEVYPESQAQLKTRFLIRFSPENPQKRLLTLRIHSSDLKVKQA